MSDWAAQTYTVCLIRDLPTPSALVARGAWVDAVPLPDRWWRVRVPQSDGSVFEVPVPSYFVRRSRQRHEAIARKQAAREDYEHARNGLGWSNEDALRWLAETHKVTFKTLREWGFAAARLEAAERFDRERRAAS